MRRTSPVSIYLDPEMKAYLQQIAGSRRMTLSDFCMHLMAKGLVSDELEQGVERIKDVFNGITSDTVLREVLAVRYLLERHATSKAKFEHRLLSGMTPTNMPNVNWPSEPNASPQPDRQIKRPVLRHKAGRCRAHVGGAHSG